MRPKILVLCAALAMIVSAFVPWLKIFPGADLTPYDVARQLNADRLADIPVAGWMFLASYALAAMVVVAGAVASAPRGLAFLAGAMPFVLLGYLYIRLGDQIEQFGLPQIDLGDPGASWDVLRQILDIGAWLWIGGAALLILFSLVLPRGRLR